MTSPTLPHRRLAEQRLAGHPLATAREVVSWVGAMQAQEYPGAAWSLAMRMDGATAAAVDRAFGAGEIVRTHVMRPTWHFVAPADLRWLLELTAPRVRALLAFGDRRMEIDAAVLGRSHAVLEAALRDGDHLTRPELGAALELAGIPAPGLRLGHLVMHAELDALLVSGRRRGRQITYSLLDLRAPGGRRLGRDEALAELTLRYFTGHGPAQPQDFAWWSGLTVSDARRGLAMAGPALVREEVGGRSFWSSPGRAVPPAAAGPVVHLLPNYDEYVVAYRDRTDMLDPARGFDTAPFPNGSLLAHVVVLNGQVWGGWKRRQASRRAVVELLAMDAMGPAETAGLERAADGLARFLGVPVTVERGSAT